MIFDLLVLPKAGRGGGGGGDPNNCAVACAILVK